MRQLHIIPDRKRIEETLELAEEYHAVFEYNDFFHPAVLDDKKKIDELVSFYIKQPRDRSRDTMHGAFLDITIHSEDSMIRQASGHRIRQSMDIARDMGLRGWYSTRKAVWVPRRTVYRKLAEHQRGVFRRIIAGVPGTTDIYGKYVR